MADIPASTSTTATISVGGTVTGSLETAGDHDWYAINLTAGQTIVISEDGSALSDPDSYLNLRDASGNIIAWNDDSGGTRNASIYFQVTTSGTYYIDAGAWDTQSQDNPPDTDYITGNYTLTVQPYTAPPVYTYDQIATQLTTDYWNYDGQGPHRFNVSQGGTITVNVSTLTAQEQTLARAALAEWSDIIGVTFKEVTGSTNGTPNGKIVFSDAEDPDNPDGVAQTDSISSGGFINVSNIQISTSWVTLYEGDGVTTSLDSYAFQTYVHEVGHALGLGHGGNYNGDATYATDALYANDGWATTIMSYFSQADNFYFQNQGFTELGLVTPMEGDILAMQQLYGLSTTTRTGNTTYGVSSNAGDVYNSSLYPNVAYTIFDSGGTDTLDYSGSTANQLINLNPETFMNIGGNTGNVMIARGVTIENAVGGDGADTLMGNSVDNVLDGRAGNDSLSGGAGNDTLLPGWGNNNVNGGAGSDTVDYSQWIAGAVSVNLGSGTATNNGGAGSDTLTSIENVVGSSYDDTIVGDSGANVIDGFFGNDSLDGGAGVDTVSYALTIPQTGVTVNLSLSGAQNTVGAGNDTLINFENISGSQFGDTLTGNSGANTIWGLGGNDTLDGGGGNDTLIGGAGNDTYIVDKAGDVVTENAGEGTDLVQSSVSYNLSANVENLTLTGSLNISGTGNSLANTITGNSAGNTLNGLGGADTLVGGGGNDTYIVDNAGDLVTEGSGAGTDLVKASVSYSLGANVENLTLFGAAAIDGTGNALANVIHGNDAANVLDGADGNDTLTSRGGNDSLTGGNGNDTLNGGTGADGMTGGSGNDIYYVDNAGDVVTENSGEGTDVVNSSISWTMAANVEKLVLTGTAAIDGTGNGLDNVITGTTGANLLDGGTGADSLWGYGGNDTLIGGAGRDILVGGTGNDSFVFRDGDFGGNNSSTGDRITDFTSGSDKIDLSQADSNTLLGGDQAFTFVGTAAFSGTAGELHYQQISGNTYVSGDTNGDGVADFMIKLDGLHTLSGTDFGL